MELKTKIIIGAAVALVIIIIILSVLSAVVFRKSCNDIMVKYNIAPNESWGLAENNEDVKNWWKSKACHMPGTDNSTRHFTFIK